MELPAEIVADLRSFGSSARSWTEWPRWFAIHAERLVKTLERGRFEAIKGNPKVAVFELLADLGVEFSIHQSEEIVIDPLERNPHFAAVLAVAEAEAESEAASAENGDAFFGATGDCHLIWSAKKRILKDRFGLDWKSPADLNPGINFD